MLNPFSSDAFEMAALTAAINKIPNTYGRLEQLNIMSPQGVRTRTIIIEEMSGVLNLLPTQPVGSPGTQGSTGKRKVRSFVIPHIPHDDAVLPEEVQGIRAFGSETETDALSNLLALKLQNMRNKHAITLEYLRMGALKGVIFDADGSTLYDLYSEFGITAKTVSFVLGTAGTEVLLKVLEVKRHIEDNLKGEFMTGVMCLCSQGFYDAFTTHAKVKEAFMYFQRNQQLGNDYRTGFTFGGITFEEYRGQATDAAGNVRKFVADDEAHFFPLGTANTFRTYFAPADFNETANTLGLALYAKQEPRKFGRGTDLHTQQNPLPICLRPEVLVKGTKA
ncbi:MAG: major capsid protein E [Acidobacteria bacterium RIFCSPLOWO2_12_FULL_59_11]|nr:MAG: major capsid protein E [Acidobacteria bacterium RIFCSPLOWO2_12_FULL_59_11]